MDVPVTVDSFTEAEVLAALRRRFTETGNGGSGRYAFLTHVRTGASFGAQEIDAVAFCLWSSDRHSLLAFEVKVSRADWLHEIKPDTTKSERARQLCDSLTIVAPVGVVADGELPYGWGLITVARGPNGLVLRQRVTPHPRDYVMDPKPDISRSFLVALLRAAGAVPGMTTGQRRARVDRLDSEPTEFPA